MSILLYIVFLIVGITFSNLIFLTIISSSQEKIKDGIVEQIMREVRFVLPKTMSFKEDVSHSFTLPDDSMKRCCGTWEEWVDIMTNTHDHIIKGNSRCIDRMEEDIRYNAFLSSLF